MLPEKITFLSSWESLEGPINFLRNRKEDAPPTPTHVLFGPKIFARSSSGIQSQDPHAQQRTFAELLCLLSPSLEELRIRVDRTCIVDFRKSFYQALDAFPKLKTFHLSFQNVLDPDYKSYCYIYSIGELVEKIFSTSTVLEEVEIDWMTGSQQVDYYEDNYLKKLPACLKSLSLSKNRMRPITPKILSSVSLPALRTLNLDFTDSLLTGQDVLKMLDAFRDTLVSLSLTNYELREISFPEFRLLIVLELEIGQDVVLSPGFCFSDTFPRVVDLRLRHVRSASLLAKFFPADFQLPKIQTFHVPDFIHTSKNVTGMIELLSGFPGLKTLICTSILGMDTIKPIFKMLPGLTDLRLEFGSPNTRVLPNSIESCEDAALTGVSFDQCRALADRPELKNLNIDEIKFEAGLADLKDLQVLHITSKYQQWQFTDAAAYFGIMQLNKLVELEMEKFEFSETCLADLESRFGKILV